VHQNHPLIMCKKREKERRVAFNLLWRRRKKKGGKGPRNRKYPRMGRREEREKKKKGHFSPIPISFLLSPPKEKKGGEETQAKKGELLEKKKKKGNIRHVYSPAAKKKVRPGLQGRGKEARGSALNRIHMGKKGEGPGPASEKEVDKKGGPPDTVCPLGGWERRASASWEGGHNGRKGGGGGTVTFAESPHSERVGKKKRKGVFEKRIKEEKEEEKGEETPS